MYRDTWAKEILNENNVALPRVVPGVPKTLGETSCHFDPTKPGQKTCHHDKAAAD